MNRPIDSPHKRGNHRAVIYAVLMHLVLLSVLLYGVRWRNKPSAGAEAQLWSAAEITLAPPKQRAPSSAPASPASAQSAPLRSDPTPAQIALERARQRQQQEALQRAQQKKQEAQRLRQQQEQRVEQEKAAQEKKRLAQRQQQRAEQQRQQQEQKKVEQLRALQAQQQVAQRAKAQARIEQQRLARLETLAQAAGVATNSAGIAQSGAGNGAQNSPGYADKVQQRVKPNLVFDPQTLSGNPSTIVSIQCAPDGTILNVYIARSSSFSEWDNAVLRAVQKSDPMPRDMNGRAPGRFTITFRPKD